MIFWADARDGIRKVQGKFMEGSGKVQEVLGKVQERFRELGLRQKQDGQQLQVMARIQIEDI